MRSQYLKNFFKYAPFGLSLLMIVMFLIDFGFMQAPHFEKLIDYIYIASVSAFVVLIIGRYLLFPPKRQRIRTWIIDFVVLVGLIVIVSDVGFIGYFQNPVFLYISFFIIFIRELTSVGLGESRRQLNPALLFVVSFLLLILAGTLLLLMPNATHNGISLIDAFFTSTSAVCVTGLVVVDTGSYFTPTGQTIIMILIQLGGLGIMTFTTFFSYFFKGSTTFEDQLMLKDLINTDRVGEVFGTLKTIIGVTFLVEAAGAIFIYFSITNYQSGYSIDNLFFSVFHSISAFCNAGFSTLANSLYQPEFRFNYSLQLTIAFLFIIGGLGFPIVFNLLKYLQDWFKRKFSRKKQIYKRPYVISITSKIILITTSFLIIFGFATFFIFEFNNTLKEHSLWGKIVTAFFSGVTPRTAGFNAVDMTALHFGTIMIIFFLMWIGASPGSTGGGIKTTAFAIGTLNYISLAKGKERIEAFGREISNQSVRRAFAVISLSLVVIGISIFLLAIFDADKNLLDIAFESFSAYSTVGLSLGITADLSTASKVVIIFTMFIGRVSMLNILVAFFRKVNTYSYKYPSENILIN